jgi:hypothetical protein
MAGRVVTAQFMPVRPDLNELITAGGKQKSYHGGQNQWVIDKLQPGDVVVVDLFGKTEGGTFVGDNLFYYIQETTKNAGIVIDGAIRDLEGASGLTMPAYFRGVHPGAIRDVMLTGLNVPVRIGNATVMPGRCLLHPAAVCGRYPHARQRNEDPRRLDKDEIPRGQVQVERHLRPPACQGTHRRVRAVQEEADGRREIIRVSAAAPV